MSVLPLFCPYYRYFVRITVTSGHDILNTSYVDSTGVIWFRDRALTEPIRFDLFNFSSVNETRLRLAVNAMYFHALFLFVHWMDWITVLSEAEANVTRLEL